jgi:MFS family permease
MSFFSFIRANASWLGAGFLLALLSSFGQTFFISIFSGALRNEFDLTHAEWGATYALGTFSSAVVMVWAGGLSDRFRTRYLGVFVLLGLAFSASFMMLNTSATLLILVIFCLRFFGQGMATHLSAVAMSRWFSAQRGRALSIANMGYALGEASLPVAFVVLLVFVEWRWLWGVAALIAILAAPVLFALLKTERTPQSMAQSDTSIGMGQRHWTRVQALRHPLFWYMVPALLGPPAFGTAFFFQQVPFAEAKGWTHLELVAAFPFYTVFAITATLGAGWMQDRFGTPKLIPTYQIPAIAAFAIFGMSGNPWHVIVGLFFMGLTSGAVATWQNGFWAEFYGTKHLGALKAMASAIMVLGSAIGPGLTGLFLDLGVGLSTQYLWVAAYFALSTCFMMMGVRRYRWDMPRTYAT